MTYFILSGLEDALALLRIGALVPVETRTDLSGSVSMPITDSSKSIKILTINLMNFGVKLLIG